MLQHPMRAPKRNPISAASRAIQLLAGFSSPRTRLASAQRLLAHFLWALPRTEIDQYLQIADRLSDASVEGARLYADREAMVHALPQGGVVAEVGTWQGYFAKHIARTCRPDVLHLIDLSFAELDEPGLRAALEGGLIKHQGDSSTILAGLPAGTFDWIYVDGDHSYDAVVRDLAAAHRALKQGGHLMCNDYTNWCSPSVVPYGVAKAVNEFVMAQGYSVEGLALHPAFLCDILIRKPGQQSARAVSSPGALA